MKRIVTQEMFRKSLVRWASWLRLHAMLGPTEGRSGLLWGGDEQLLALLQRRGGHWQHKPFTDLEAMPTGPNTAAADSPEQASGEETNYDILVLVDVLRGEREDADAVRHAHRMLKPGGLLIVIAQRRRDWTPLALVLRLLMVGRRQGYYRGFTTRALFDLLKDGFDVHAERGYSRFFSEATDILSSCLAGWLAGSGASTGDQRLRIIRWQSPLLWLAPRLDYLLVLSRGYRLAAGARRRIWKPRKRPVLRDGRSLAEVTLGGKIGTANPFEAQKQNLPWL